MKKTIFTFLILIFSAQFAAAQTSAQKRAERMGLGMNLSYLDNWWLGTKAKNYGDFVKLKEAAKREKMFADIAKAGFKTVRIPIDFGAWANYEKPYAWENEEGLRAADSFVKWALDNNLNAIIDLHHVEFDGSVKGAATTERIVWLWKRIAERYKSANPEKVFFELRNEPHDIKAEDWRAQAEEIIKAVRQIAPNHTLIVGFHDWNSRAALIDSKPFEDKNIIYTFHYYDPFVFTHQGANWSAEGLRELKNVPFPWSKENQIKTPETGKGKWVEGLINNYQKDSLATKMFDDLKAAKDWSEKNKVPIFLGEFGSFSKFAALDDRCRHAETVYTALGKLKIPNAWWEWDGGFNMFRRGTTEIADCMRKAIDSYNAP
ncbi:MAG TPA: glycoside hydrolase family 5 protein [Pyrinomonadaceae bacterium]|nr:glycoside hydrolase family 5 protein [Pyrinomonadaceae bacterium]